MSGILRFLQTLAGRDACRDAGDGELLARFVRGGDEAAFAALVERHGGMVLAACRRILGAAAADAEDVLQATFLVLVRKAATIRNGDSVGSWLYGVAVRLARKRWRQRLRQRAGERAAAREARTESLDELSVAEARRLLDEELAALPEKYRAPLVLCALEGKARDEAAAELGWAPGAVKIRLERGRELLRRRLLRRGVTPSSALLLAVLETGVAPTLPARLAAGVVEAALSGAASPAVLALAADGLAATVPAWLTAAACAVLLAGGLAWGAWILRAPATTDPPAEVHDAPPPTPGPAPAEPAPEPVPPREGTPFLALFVGVEEQTVVLRQREVNTRYRLAPETSVWIDGQPARFADLKNRARLLVVPSADGQAILRVELQP